jgi:hypothetical protein
VNEQLSETVYRCPGESYTISRVVHLARLAGYYAPCRDCPRREDTVGLSARQVRRVTEAHKRVDFPLRPGPAGIGNMPINDLSPPAARAVAIEFTAQLQSSRHAPRAVRPKLQASEESSSAPQGELNTDSRRHVPIVFACDGRLSTAAIVAAVVDGIRWTGCEAIDLGPASAPCTARAIKELAAAGGIYLGNPSDAAHTVGMKFWAGGRRIGFNPTLFEGDQKPAAFDRPVRAFGPLRRWDAAEGYLNALRSAYHALRPLKFVLQCSCEPVSNYLNDLLQNVACRVIPSDPGSEFSPQVSAAKAHFGIEITDDGERAEVFDEQGRGVAIDQLKNLIPAEADALRTLTHLLVLLSRDDLTFSAVLDRAGRAR